MREVKVKRVGEDSFEITLPFWYWDFRPYVVEGLRQIVAGGDLPLYVCKKFCFSDAFIVATTRIDALKV